MQRSKIYSDIDLSMTIHPLNGDINILHDETAVKTAIKHALLANKGDVKFHPEKVVGLRDLLFEPANFITLDAMKQRVKIILEKDVPRVKIINIEVSNNERDDSVNIEIRFSTLNLVQEITTNLYMQRIR